MMIKVLVAGYLASESGKTILAASLISALRREGFDSVGFKPVGATELWFKPWILEESRKRRHVVTADSLILEKASRFSVQIHVLNPVAGILAPIDPSKLDWVDSFFDFYHLAPPRRLGLLRLTSCLGGNITTIHFINQGIQYKLASPIAQMMGETALSLNPPPISVSTRDLEHVMDEEAAVIADTCLSHLEDREITVIESNSDIAAPTRKSLESKLVIVASHSIAAIVDGERYSKAVNLRSIGGKPWSINSRDVLSLTKAKATINLPPKNEPLEGYRPDELNELIEEIKGLARK
ncbi:MAG: hypothetical protein P3X22_005515 [Thermoprotei archaeon]|nr:hypothetical protein [Thermoprotei archaeon]